MTTAAPNAVDWREHAACAGKDTNLWYSTNPARALEICGGCQVRIECLYDAVRTETPYTRHGVRGGLTRADREALPALPAAKADAIAALRELLPAPDPDDHERTDQPMSGTPTDSIPAPPEDSEKIPVGQLLKWGQTHTDPKVQKLAEQARATLLALRKRHAADQELAALDAETEQLQKRLAEVQARKAELAPAKASRRKHSYKAVEVRAWAAANGIDCPPVGRVPTKVVDAWRAAEGKETADA